MCSGTRRPRNTKCLSTSKLSARKWDFACALELDAPSSTPTLCSAGTIPGAGRPSAFSGPVNSLLQPPFQMQPQPQSSSVQYQLLNGSLVPGLAMQQRAVPAIPSSSPALRPSMSHLYRAHMPSGQPVRPNQAMFQGQPGQAAAQAGVSRPLNRTGAGYMAGSRNQAQAQAQAREYPLKPGHNRCLIFTATMYSVSSSETVPFIHLGFSNCLQGS